MAAEGVAAFAVLLGLDGSPVWRVVRVLVVTASWPRPSPARSCSCTWDRSGATLAAVGQAFPPPRGWARQAAVPFSSARKWSAASFTGHGTWVLGAPEMVLPSGHQEHLAQATELAASGRRVLVLARSAGSLDGESLPPGLRPAAFIVFAERLRSDAAEAIGYFAAQGVALKVISGDSPLTVSAVAKRAGLPRPATPSTRGTCRRTPPRSAQFWRSAPCSAG